MKTIPLRLTSRESPTQMSARVEQAVAHAELKIASITSLATRGGSVHWHIVRAGGKGTLELTFIPRTNELWFAIHENRWAAWMAGKISALKKDLERESKTK